MKKRKTTARKRVVTNDLAFDFVTRERHRIQVISIFGCDHYKATFDPPLVGEAWLRVTHVPSQRSDVCIALHEGPSVVDGSFRVYETHALSTDGAAFYIALENTSLNGNADDVLILRPVFDFGIAFQERYKRLAFVAPDALAGVDAALIPQHNPLWTKSRGKITSSSVARYLGYFVPDPKSKWDKEKAEKWTLKTKEAFTGWKGVRVRFGAIKECEVVAAYLAHFKTRTFYQTGYNVHPRQRDEWGASPDGLVKDASGETRTVEIKSSMTNPHMQGYYIPQVVWEMACLDVQKGDLIKYCEKKQNNNSPVAKTCRVVTLDRDLELEAEIEELVQATKRAEEENDTAKFKELVFSPKYRAFRDRMDKKAETEAYEEITVADWGEKLNAYRAAACSKKLPSNHPCLEAIEERQMLLHCAFNENRKREFHRMALEQIQDYSELLKY